MYVSNTRLVHDTLLFFKESLLGKLSDQQKRVLLIVSFIFAAFSACFLVHYFYFKSRNQTSSVGIANNSVNDQQIVNAKSSQISQQTLGKTSQTTGSHLSEESGLNQEKDHKGGTKIKIPYSVKKTHQDKSPSTDVKASLKLDSLQNSDKLSFGDNKTPVEKDSHGFDIFDSDEDGDDEWDSFSDADIGDADSGETLSPKQKESYEINGKDVSKRTYKCLKRLEVELDMLGKCYGEAVDNGDCFWHAFAQQLSIILKREVTIEELRKKVSEEVSRLDQGPDEENWVKAVMKGDTMDSYEEYRDEVAFTCDEVLKRGLAKPIWGREGRDGKILTQLYQVNLKVYFVGYLKDKLSKMDNKSNFYWGIEDIPSDLSYSQTVEIALYPGHFLPVNNSK